MKYFFSLAIFLIILGGCSGINTVTSSNGMNYTKIGDPFLNEIVKVKNIKVTENKTSRIVNVQLQNLEFYEVHLEVKADFFDKNGIQIDNPWGYKPISIQGEQTAWVKFIAPSKKAKNFRLFVQFGGN